MYLEFFGLKENPFTISPDPKYIYYSPTHKEALSQMIYCVNHNCGFMLLTGEVGTGKTSLVNAFKKYLPPAYQAAVLSHAILSPRGLLQSICKAFGVRYLNLSVEEMLHNLQDYLRWKHHVGKKLVLIIDEAQILATDILEHIRLLSNFEEMNEKYLQILLVGQPEIKTKLKAHSLRPLTERILLHYDLERLDLSETNNYIYHRLKVAGYPSGNNLFSKEVIGIIYHFSQGIPRRINICCDKAMLIGYSKNKHHIG